MASLSAAEVARYHRDGYLIPDYRLGEAWLARMQAALARLLGDNPGVRPEKLVSAHIEGNNGEGVRGVADFLALAMHEDIVDLVQGVV